MCWRIMRIEGDGSVKLILASQSGECSDYTLSDNSGYIRNSNGNIISKDNGYKTKTLLRQDGTNRNVWYHDYLGSTTGAKQGIEDWFSLKNFDTTILKNDLWCLGNLTDIYNNNGVKYELTSDMVDYNGNQYESIQDYLLANSNTRYNYKNAVSKYMSLQCNDEKDESYKSYVGLLTSIEYRLAGSNSYMRKNATTNYWWTSSLGMLYYQYDRVFYIEPTGTLGCSNLGLSNTFALRPSIVLKSGIELTGGNGSLEHPYEVE